MRGLIWLILLATALWGLVGITSPVEAATGDADGIYTVTMLKVEVSKNSGSTYTAIFNGSSNVNIAAAGAGSRVAGLASGAALEPGTYDRVRVTLGANLLLKGFVNDGTTTFYTNNDSDGFGLNLNAANTPGTDYATSTFTIPSGSRLQTFTTSITMSEGGVSPTIRISFDTSGVLTVSGNTPAVGAPTVSITSA